MTTYNTGNPVGSVDVRDLYDNAENLDKFTNGPLDAYPDRFGVPRQSLQGIRNASQYQVLGPYAAGLVFTQSNQVFSYLGEFYAPGPSITLPYTTTGVGAAEIANFRSVGDAVLRQDLANDADPAKGAGQVGRAGQVVNSISDLRSLDKTAASKNAFVTGYYAAGDGGGGDYYLDSADTTSADNGGTVIVAVDGARWKLAHKDRISFKQFGARAIGATMPDNATQWQAANTYCATNHVALYIPDGRFYVSAKAVIDGAATSFAFVRIIGDGRATGTALAAAPVRCGPVIITDGDGALEVWFRIFSNEGVTVDGVSFYDLGTPARAVGHAIKLKKGDPSSPLDKRYVTNLNFFNIACVGYEHPIVVQGMYPNSGGFTELDNYIGPMHIHRYYPYRCGSAVALINCTANRFRMSESLMFELSHSGIFVDKAIATSEVPFLDATGGSLLGQFNMVHFEDVVGGCFKLSQVAAGIKHSLTLIDVTRELCGVSGAGVGDPYGMNTPVELLISGRTDGGLAFGEDSFIIIPPGSSISSETPITVTTVAAGNDLDVLSPRTINNISVSGTVPGNGSITKTIILSNPADYYSFDMHIRYTAGVGGDRVAHISGTSGFSGISAITGAANPVMSEVIAFPIAGHVTIQLTNSDPSPVSFEMKSVNFTGMKMEFLS